MQLIGEKLKRPNPISGKFVRGCTEENSAGNAL